MTDMRVLWGSLNKKGEFDFISHLQSGAQWDQVEFHLTGIRFVERMAERFSCFGKTSLSHSSILEIGCGVGRFLRPLSGRFKLVFGVDISEQMLASAKKHCASLPNILLSQTDGKSLSQFEDDSVDYVVSAGVFQHITDFDAILSYIREGLRVLRPNGLMLFQFEGNRTSETGSGQVGAKISAKGLDLGLQNEMFKILEVSEDPTDKVRNIVVVIQKCRPELAEEKLFTQFPIQKKAWLEGVYDDIKTKTRMHERQAAPELELTFYD